MKLLQSMGGVQSMMGGIQGIQTLANSSPTASAVFLNHSIAKHIKPESKLELVYQLIRYLLDFYRKLSIGHLKEQLILLITFLKTIN